MKWLDHESRAEWLTLDEIKKWAKKDDYVESKGFKVFENDKVVIYCMDKAEGIYGSCTKIYKYVNKSGQLAKPIRKPRKKKRG